MNGIYVKTLNLETSFIHRGGIHLQKERRTPVSVILIVQNVMLKLYYRLLDEN